MRILDIGIKNFRSCKALQLRLNHFCVLVGYNNTGKSNTLRAIDFVLNAKDTLDEEYFWDASLPIEISFTLKKNAHTVNTNYKTLSRFFSEDVIAVRVQRKITDNKNTYFALNPVKGRYEKLTLTDCDTLREIFPKIMYLNAARQQVFSSRSVTGLELLIEGARKHIDATHLSREEKNALKEKFLTDLNTALSLFYPGLCANVSPKGAITLLLTEEGKHPQAVTRKDTVFIHAVQMAVLVFLAEKKDKITLEKDVILMLDEPESHLHPVMVEIVAEALVKLSHHEGIQVLLTTHSPAICQNSEAFLNTKIIKKSASRGTYTTTKFIGGRGVSTAAQKFISLTNSAYALFANRVILVEGTIDKILLSAILRKEMPQLYPKVAFVVADGNNLIESLYKICETLGLSPRGVGDLDHLKAYETGPYTTGAIAALVGKIKRTMSEEKNLKVPEWPGRASLDSSRIAFMRLHTKAPELVDALCEKLLKRGIWLWPTGDIEAVFGFKKHATIEEARERSFKIIESDKPWEVTVAQLGGNVKLLRAWLTWATKGAEL